MQLVAPSLLIAVVAAFILHRAIQIYLWNKKYRLPPRLPGLPLLGNTFQLPLRRQGIWAREKAQQYGEMFTCQIGSNTWIFLNSSRVVRDLLEKRAPLYSSRPAFPMTQDVLSGGCRMVLMPYSEKWRALRKVMHQVLNTRQADHQFRPYQDLESKQLLYDYLHRPEKWFVANQRFANAVIMSVVFGRRLQLDDPEMKELFESSENFLENLQPGANLVDGFQFLDKLPTFLKWWRPYGRRWFEFTCRVYRREVSRLMSKMQNGTARPCFAVDFLKAADEGSFPFDVTQKLFTLGSLIEAGSDTSRMVIGQILAAAGLYPDWVERAREELNAVCGKDAERLPNFEDKPALPYITAVVKESLRWRPIVEIGMPHMLTQDDEYEGYRFPAGTIFTWNSFAIALDPKEYEDPERFYPERFLNEDLDNPLKGHWAFGPGRRVCAGWNVGATNIWIAAARLLYCFDFEQDLERPIDTMRTPWHEFKTAAFAVRIKVRSQGHEALIERDCAEALNVNY